VKALVEAGANVNAQHRQVSTQHTLLTTPIHLAILYEHGDVADFLMAHGVIIPKPAPITDKIAAADPEKGRMFFENNCQHCHIVLPELGEIGPHLWNIVGRDKASLDYKGYSKTLRAREGVWTYEDLNTYLSGPAVTTPGVNMQTEGATNETDRVNVIAYLRTLSDNPVPLP
jgi:cytochrome c